MEFDENNALEEQGEDAVEIYSKNAIFWFSVFASPLIGGVLLVLNLKEAGYKRGMYTVLAFTILYTAAINIATSEFMIANKIDKLNVNVPDKNFFIFSSISIGLNVAGGLILSMFFFKKYFPDDDYYPKSIVVPLLVVILLVVALKFIGIGL